jgi:regulation of enolase protein 1 (concanavalin A-like superfamily)
VQWLNEPARWSAADRTLIVTADPGTDFWRTTHYGFVHDTGHLYGESFGGDFDLSVRVRGAYAAQYDQAGVMVRVDERRWLKTGIEFVDGQIRFSTVVTLDYSSWAVASLSPGLTELELVLARRGDAVEVHYRADADPPELAAVVYLPPGEAVLAGPMCAAPEGDGFEVTFRDLRIAPA